MPKKKTAEDNEAIRSLTLTGALSAAVVSVLLGLILGFFNLATIPVTEVRERPPEDQVKPRTVYYVVGQDRGGSAYRGKLNVLLQGQSGTFQFNESDLNTWARDTFKFGGPGGDTTTGFIKIKPASPRFHIKDGRMTMAMPMEVDAFGRVQKVLVQSKGTFSEEDGVWQFIPEETHMGSASLPEGPLSNAALNSLQSVFRSSDEYAALNQIWRELSEVNITGDELVLVRR